MEYFSFKKAINPWAAELFAFILHLVLTLSSFTIVIFIHYKPRIAVAILDL